MPATRDKNQKVTFVYSNLYQVYKKGLEAARTAGSPVGLTRGKVLKPGDVHESRIQVESYRPASLAAPSSSLQQRQHLPMQQQKEALQSLRDNLKSLNDLHSRLRFMLKELEDLVRE